MLDNVQQGIQHTPNLWLDSGTADNHMSLVLACDSRNESLARTAVAAFIAQLDPSMSLVSDVKTAVSEAVTNAIIHGYHCQEAPGTVTLNCSYLDRELYIEVKDTGIGIYDVEEAMTPLYTTKPDQDRSGLGFTVMESFMDSVSVDSRMGEGTTVRMMKRL